MLRKYKLFVVLAIASLFVISSFGNAILIANTDEKKLNINIIFKEIFGTAFEKSTISGNRAEIVINVSKHVLPGSDLTLEEWEAILQEWIRKANEVWDGILEFRQVGSIDSVDNTSSNRTAGAINIYGRNQSATPPANPGSCYDQTHIVVGNGSANDTLAHEFGHWFHGIPDNTTGEHGNATGTYPGHPGYSGYDTDGDGDCDENDTGNIMFPGTSRNGTRTDPRQRDRVRDNASRWRTQVNAIVAGYGHDAVDTIGDAFVEFIDISQVRVWIEYVNGEYLMHFTLVLQFLLMGMDTMLGIYFNSDGDLTTGEPGTGIDYYLAINPFNGELVFNRCDDGTWVPGEPAPIQIAVEELWVDGPIPEMPVGFTFTLPLSSLIRHGEEGDDFSFYAQTTFLDFFDIWPNLGLCNIIYPPVYVNQPPSAPEINGPVKGKPNVELDYNFVSFDPEGDDVYYYVDWGDGDNSGWIGPYASGDEITQSHTFTKKDDYTIEAKAKDTNGNEGPVGTFDISIPRNRVSNARVLLDIFEKLFQKSFLIKIIFNL